MKDRGSEDSLHRLDCRLLEPLPAFEHPGIPQVEWLLLARDSRVLLPLP